jgi:glycosyltransferase involved in cell wall biosynthesis
MKIAIAYDCLFPNTVGGAERWYRNLAERLEDRHSVTYLTRTQWGDEGPGTSFETLAVSPASGLYTASGRRRIWPPLRYGLGVFWHLLRNGRRYDAVHTASFPYFHLLGARVALWLSRSRARLIVDWHEVWGRDYWRSYLGPIGGRIGFAVERLCVRLSDRSFTFSRLAAGRLREYGHHAPVTRLTGQYSSAPSDDDPRQLETVAEPDQPLIVAAGRHIPEKRMTAIPAAVAATRRRLPKIRCLILGDGPETDLIRAEAVLRGVGDAIELRGRVGHAEVMRAIATATCLLHPSQREGYGLVILEASSQGTPSIVVQGPENAAVELVEEGVNGFVLASADPELLADAVVRVAEGGSELRSSTIDWYRRHREQLSLESSLREVEKSYSPVARR